MKKDGRTTITYRDCKEVVDLFEELLDVDDRNSSEVIRNLVRQYIEENGVTEEAKESILRDLEDRIYEKRKELEELERKKERIENLSEEVEFDDDSEDGSDDWEWDDEDWEYSREEIEFYAERDERKIPPGKKPRILYEIDRRLPTNGGDIDD